MPTIVICDPVHKDAITMLNDAGYIVIDVSNSKEKIVNSLQGADALVVRSATKVTSEILSNAPNLKIVGRSGVGLDNIDLEQCKKLGIEVVNSPEGPTRSVAELTLALMLSIARKLGKVVPETKNGLWPKKTKGTELYNKTLGIIGTGAIGGVFARYAIAIGMKVLGYDIIEYDELKSLKSFSYVDLDTLLKNSDVISLHVPLLPATKHMLNEDAFSKMKDGVLILNCARGGTIDEDALLRSLNNGKVSGAGLDVFEKEPVDVSRELIQHPLVITTPHIGAQTNDASRKNSTIISEKIIAFFSE